jgi:hypothetical protein
MATRADAVATAKEVARANAEADALEVELLAARERASAAGRTAQTVGEKWTRIEQGQKLAAGAEFRQLKQVAEAVLAEKPDKTRVTHDTRRYARSMVGAYVLGAPGALPQLDDPRWGALHGLQGRVVQFMGMIGDADLYDAADALECKLHRACTARLRWLAGEE